MAFIDVVRFGQPEPLEVTDDQTVTFPRGLVGMEHLRRFVVVADERVEPCRWLQSLDVPSLAFLVVDPTLIEPAYALELPDEEARVLGFQPDEPRDVDIWVLITLQTELEQSTANLLAPVLIDPVSRHGVQAILHESGYSLRHALSVPPGVPGVGGSDGGNGKSDARPSA